MANKTCDCKAKDSELVNKIVADMAKKTNLPSISKFFKILGDETRINIMFILFENEVSVNDIAVILNMTKSAISHQLKLLKEEGHIKSRKDGKNIYYSLDDTHVFDILQQASEHVEHQR